ncbi:MAG: hypothetical protein ACFFDY_11125 [Candidatus Thorarchaeota archaeon]
MQNWNESKLNKLFQIFLSYLQSILGIPPLTNNIHLKLSEKGRNERYEIKNTFDFGITRKNENLLEINQFNEDIIPYILFREANYLFFPKTVIENIYLKLIINIFIENQFYEMDTITNWKKIIRTAISDLYDINVILPYFDKIFKSHRNYSKFVKYIWNNISLLDLEDFKFILPFFYRFADATLEEIHEDHVVETIRVFNEIFKRVKSYSALLEYQDYFKKFKEEGSIETDLSLRKFTSTVQKFQVFSIAPTYQVNWHTLNVSNNYFILKFHPLIKPEQVNKILEKFPFIITPKISQSNFALEISGFFIIPRIYLEDLKSLFKKMEQEGYVIKRYLFNIDCYEIFTNLNFFRDKFKNRRLINSNHKDYEHKYELQFRIKYGQEFNKYNLSLEDFLILDKLRFFSYSGFGLERRGNTLQQLKEDLLIEYSKQESIIIELQEILVLLYRSNELRDNFFQFLNNFKKVGILYIDALLKSIVKILKIISTAFEQNHHLHSTAQFNDYVRNNGISSIIEDNLVFNNKDLKKSLYKDFIPLYLKSKTQFNKEKKKYELFKNLIAVCKKLMIFDLNSVKKLVEDPKLAKRIYNTKQNKLKKSYKRVKERDITSNYVENKLDDYTSREIPIIKPNIQQSFMLIKRGKYMPLFLLNDTPDYRKQLRNLKSFFPRLIIRQVLDLFTNQQYLCAELHGFDLINKEKELLCVIIYNLLKNGIIHGNRYFWKGVTPAFSMRDFYDFSSKQFFYTPDLFDEFFLYIQKVFGENPRKFSEIASNLQKNLWSKEKNINTLINQVSSLKESFILNQLYDLKDLNKKLISLLLNQKEFESLKETSLFNEHIQSIRFIPSFRSYRFSQYYLYLRPINPDIINLKLLFTNTFQSFKFIGSIEDSVSFFMKYIFPMENPNKSFLNWHLYSAKDISEYCMFSIKRMHSIFHLEFNFTDDGWDYDINNFKRNLQNILFNPSKKRFKPEKVEFNYKTIPRDDCLGPESQFYQYLTEVYDTTSINIKSLRIKYDASKLDKVRTLIKEELIFPYIKLENIGLPEKLTLIIPDIKKENIEKLIDIFSFFNLVKIYEIEGDFFIYGFPEEKKFEDGLMVKIYFPFKHDIFRFIEVFNLLFEFLEIDYFLIIDSIFDGKNLLKHVYGSLNFLKKYNPLKNLKWNNKDKIWMNHKLYNEKFEPIYPDLQYGDKE